MIAAKATGRPSLKRGPARSPKRMRLGALAAGAIAVLRGAAGDRAAGLAGGDGGRRDRRLWLHLIRYVVPVGALQTSLLLAGVAAVTIVIGVGTAWAVTTFQFPGRDTLAWMLVLPLAIPTYIVAYIYVDLLDSYGPVQSALRAAFGWKTAADYWFPSVRSLGGAILLMGLVLYPLCLSRRARDVPDAGRAVRGSRARARREAVPPGDADLAAAGAAGDRGRRRAGAARNAQRYRRSANISACRR